MLTALLLHMTESKRQRWSWSYPQPFPLKITTIRSWMSAAFPSSPFLYIFFRLYSPLHLLTFRAVFHSAAASAPLTVHWCIRTSESGGGSNDEEDVARCWKSARSFVAVRSPHHHHLPRVTLPLPRNSSSGREGGWELLLTHLYSRPLSTEEAMKHISIYHAGTGEVSLRSQIAHLRPDYLAWLKDIPFYLPALSVRWLLIVWSSMMVDPFRMIGQQLTCSCLKCPVSQLYSQTGNFQLGLNHFGKYVMV